MAYKWGSTQKKLNKVIEKKNQNILEDLELATSEQLLEELRKRPKLPYVMLSPVLDEETNGITIEVHNMSPTPAVQILAVATKITICELKKRGVKLPEFPEMFDQEWNSSDQDWKASEDSDN